MNTVCKEHEWVEGFTPPTTTLNGKQYFRCKNCGQIKSIDFHIKDNLEVIEDNKWEDIENEFNALDIKTRTNKYTFQSATYYKSFFDWLRKNYIAPDKK